MIVKCLQPARGSFLKDVRASYLVGTTSAGKLVARPLSPHLQVYRWPVSMALSIVHRATGIGLSVGALVMTGWLLAAATSDAAFATIQALLGSPLGILLIFGWTAALILHLCLGIRHLVWDTGRGYGPLAVQEPVHHGTAARIYKYSAWIAIGIAAMAMAVVASIAIAAWR